MATSDNDAPTANNNHGGERLRTIREQKRFTLQEVEAQSAGEFKASVLGAYERGERALSVPRLDRLAQFYDVPIEQLLPRDATEAEATANDPQIDTALAIDVAKLTHLTGSPHEKLSRYPRRSAESRPPTGLRSIPTNGLPKPGGRCLGDADIARTDRRIASEPRDAGR